MCHINHVITDMVTKFCGVILNTWREIGKQSWSKEAAETEGRSKTERERRTAAQAKNTGALWEGLSRRRGVYASAGRV